MTLWLEDMEDNVRGMAMRFSEAGDAVSTWMGDRQCSFIAAAQLMFALRMLIAWTHKEPVMMFGHKVAGSGAFGWGTLACLSLACASAWNGLDRDLNRHLKLNR